MSLEVDRPLEPLGAKACLLEQRNGSINRLGGNNKVHILRHHWLIGPVVNRDAANGAPRDVRSFKAINQSHNIVRAP